MDYTAFHRLFFSEWLAVRVRIGRYLCVFSVRPNNSSIGRLGLLYLSLTAPKVSCISLLFSSLLLIPSFSLLSSRYHCLRLQWGTSTHVLQSSICSGRSNPRPSNSHSLCVFRILYVTFESLRSLYTNKRRQLERLGKCRQHLLFVRLSPPAPSHLIVNPTQQ